MNNRQRVDIGKILQQRRMSLHLDFREVSEKSGVSVSHLSRIESGNRFPSASVLRRIAGLLGYEEVDMMRQAGYLSPLKSEGAMNNPYPKVLIDEVSGVEVPDDRHRIWEESQQAAFQAVGKWLKSRVALRSSKIFPLCLLN